MKKLFFLILFVLSIAGDIQAEFCFGRTRSEIKAIYPNMEDISTDATTLKLVNEREAYYYTFDNSGLSQYYLYVPLNTVRLNEKIEEYNRIFIITSEKSWKLYVKGMIMKVELFYENGIYLFTHWMEKL